MSGPIPPWPGTQLSGLYVRYSPTPPDGGEPAVLVHGLGGASTNWTDLMDLLSGRLAALAPDLPGFGRSDPPADGDYRLRTHRRAVVRLIEETDRGPVHLFGNSLGGAVAVRIAARRPELVRTLSLVSPALPRVLPRGRADREVLVTLMPVVRALLQRRPDAVSPEARANLVAALSYADPSEIPMERRREAVAEIARRDGVGWTDEALRGSLGGLVAAYLQRGPRALWREAGQVRAPTLLVWGRQDRLVSVTLAAKALRLVPDARLVVLDDAGHVAQMERPGAVARAVLDLLDDVAAGRPARRDEAGTPSGGTGLDRPVVSS